MSRRSRRYTRRAVRRAGCLGLGCLWLPLALAALAALLAVAL
jgi:hypothetical protein